MPLTVGFDLDMTLIDARPGMALVMDQLAVETGLPLDGQRFTARLGPPLADVFLGFGVPRSRVPELITRYRQLYADIVVASTVALPGAAAALATVRAAGGRIIVVTAKHATNAAKHLTALGWRVDAVVGEQWAGGKTSALREHDAAAYVGDHVADVASARAAQVCAVAVTTGACTDDELRRAGADVVLPDLTAFPAWFGRWRGID